MPIYMETLNCLTIIVKYAVIKKYRNIEISISNNEMDKNIRIKINGVSRIYHAKRISDSYDEIPMLFLSILDIHLDAHYVNLQRSS